MASKKYLFMIFDMNVGGAEVGLVDVMNELVKTNRVDLVLLRMRGPLLDKLDPRIRVFSIMRRQKKSLYNAYIRFLFFAGGAFTRHAYKKTIKDTYDVEVAYLEGYPTIFVASSPNRNSVKIASVRVGLKKHKLSASRLFYGNRLLKSAYRRMDAVYCVSEQTRSEFLEAFPMCAHKTQALYTYFDVESIRKKATNSAPPFQEGTFNFLAVGRFAAQKAYDRLIRAFDQVHKLHPHTALHIVGDDKTEVGDNVKKLVHELGIGDCVHIHGVIDNPYPFMKHCDALVSSSLYEGYPRVVNEALALGTLVIGTDVTGTREALREGNLGVLVDDSVDGLVRGMMSVLKDSEVKGKYTATLSQFDGNKKHFFDGFERLTQKREKMAVFLPRLTIGGMEKALINLLNNDHLLGRYQITLYTAYVGQPNLIQELPEQVTLKMLWKGPWNRVGKLTTAVKLLFFLFSLPSYDLSVCYSHHFPILARLARKASKRSTLFVHSNIAYFKGTKEARKLLKKLGVQNFTNIVCVSEDSKAVIEELSGRTDVWVINNLIDGEDILRKAEGAVQDYTFTKRTTFVHVSRHEDRSKALGRLFSACQKLNKEGYEYDLLLIGDGPDHHDYQRDVQEKGLTNVIFLGKRTNPYPYMKHASAMILCSRYEGYPVVFVEAMVLGLPIITTDVSDARKDIEGQYGIVVDNNDSAIYKGMKEFLINGYDIRQDFDYKVFNENITRQICKMLDDKHGSGK